MKKLARRIIATEARLSVALMRFVLGWIFSFEGMKKLYGWFGGGGISPLEDYFQNLGIPLAHLSAYLVGYSELIAGLCLISGFLTRPAAAVIMIIMTTAVLTAHRGGGFEYPMLIGFACFVLFDYGAGRFSLDYYLRGRMFSNPSSD